MIVVKNRIGGLVLAGVVAAVAMGLTTGVVTLSMTVMGAVVAVLCGLALVMIRSALTGASEARAHRMAEPELEEAAPFPRDTPLDTAPEAEETAEDEAVDNAVRLVPVMPPDAPTTSKSWAGGSPQLPEGTEWPVFQDSPARFLAQIDCASLPPALWNGLGSRDGALVFFGFESTPDGVWPVRVMHVSGALEPLESPEMTAGRACWPLDVRPAQDFGQADQPVAPDWARLHDVDFDDPAYQPFDWTSASILLVRLKEAVQAAAEGLSGEDRAALIATARQLANLVDAVWSRREDTAFAGELRASLMTGLAGLKLPRPDGGARALMQDGAARKAYFAPFEQHCRQVYTGCPGDLPDAQRAMFEPLWMHNAYHEAGAMGIEDMFDETGMGPEEAVVLLELPSSELLGWTFGSGRSFRVFATREALDQGDLSQCWASVVG